MRYDEKTGNPVPENRKDEVTITLNRLNDIREKTNGFNDKQTEICALLGDISISNALIVDLLSVIYNRMVKNENGDVNDDERSAESP